MKKKVVSLVCGLAAVSAAVLVTWSGSGSTVRAAVNADGSVTINTKNFPDEVFRTKVSEFNKDGDKVLSKTELESVTRIIMPESSVSDLTGIEYFTELRTLDVTGNQLTKLDLTRNTKLIVLDCGENQLTELNITGLTGLTYLECQYNALPSLDVSTNTDLYSINCSCNQFATLKITSALPSLHELNCSGERTGTNYAKLSELTLTGATELTDLKCSYNNLKTLTLTKNTKLEKLVCDSFQGTILSITTNTSLTELSCSNSNLMTINFPKDKSKLKTLNVSQNNLSALDLSGASSLEKLDCCKNPSLATLTLTGCSSLAYVDVQSCFLSTLDISSCVNLETLYCQDNEISKLDLSGKTELTYFRCYNNQIKTLNLTSCSKLYMIECEKNELSSLDLSKCVNISSVECQRNQLTSLKLPKTERLYEVRCFQNNLTSLDVSNMPKLGKLDCDSNQLTSLNVSGSEMLKELDCSYNDKLTSLDVSTCTSLRELYCFMCGLTSLKVKGANALEKISCGNNKLTQLDVSDLASLKELMCAQNDLAKLTISGAGSLQTISCYENELTSLAVSNHSSLKVVDCYDNFIETLNLDGCPILLSCAKGTYKRESIYVFSHGDIQVKNYTTDTTGKSYPSERIVCDLMTDLISSGLTPTPVPAAPSSDAVLINERNFPDPCFRLYMKKQVFDKNKNGGLEPEEVQAVTSIECDMEGWQSLKGIEYFPNLKILDISNCQVTSVDISHNTKLTNLYIYSTDISKLDLSNNGELKYLECVNTKIANLDLSRNPKLIFVVMYGNLMHELNIYHCPYLVELVNTTERQEDDEYGVEMYFYSGRTSGGDSELSYEKNLQIVLTQPTPTPVTQKTVEIGKSFQYQVSGVSASNIKWSVGNTSVAMVDSTGKVTGKSFGNTYLHVGLPNGTTIKCLVKVVYPTLKINYTEKTLHINQAFQFVDSGAAGQKITWSVGNTSVASVDQNGKVTGKKTANTYLYAKSADGRVAKCLVKVIDPGKLGINYTEKTVYLGQSFTFTAKNKGILSVNWSVGNTAVATVDSTGKVTVKSVGNTYLYAKTEDGRSASCLVKVVDPGPLSITYTEKTIKVGATFQFTAKNPAGQTVSWKVGNTSVATVDASGKVTGKSVANTWLYASTPDGREVRCLLKIVA